MHFQQTSNSAGFRCLQFRHVHSGSLAVVMPGSGSATNGLLRPSLPSRYAYSLSLGVTSRSLSPRGGTLSSIDLSLHRRMNTTTMTRHKPKSHTTMRGIPPVSCPTNMRANKTTKRAQKIATPGRWRAARTTLQLGHRMPYFAGAIFDHPDKPNANSRSIRCRQFGQLRQ